MDAERKNTNTTSAPSSSVRDEKTAGSAWSLGTEIRKQRLAKGWTQKELAKLVGVAESTISGYERNERVPYLYVIKRLADVLGCTCDDLFGRKAELEEDNSWLDAVGRETMRHFERMYKELHPEHVHGLIPEEEMIPKKGDANQIIYQRVF